MNLNSKYQPVIGLEVHVQLNTNSKLFCGDALDFGAEPNTDVSAISLAHPGTLPVMNKAVLEKAIRLGLALNCKIVADNYFARKNYFYPDLPKGYQTTQHTAPICLGGSLNLIVNNKHQIVHLNRIHIEEDAGKSIHDKYDDYTCIDLNRAGTPLLEIVTEPCIHSADTAAVYLTELRKLVRWLNVGDGNMEEGSLRCDANISVRLAETEKLGTRVEIKNLNSIRNVKRAIELEIDRLIGIVESGEKVIQETRSYNADNNTSFSLRNKEEAEDYRYFPEPDLPPFHITEKMLNEIKNEMPELPEAMKTRFMKDYELNDYDASLLTNDIADAEFYSSIASHSKHYKSIANWMNGPLRKYINENNLSFDSLKINHKNLADLIEMTENGQISFAVATTKLFQAMIKNPESNPQQLAESLNLFQEKNEDSLELWVNEAIASMPEKAKEYKSGKKGLIGLFAGDVKKRSKGKADMQAVTKMLEEKLNN